MVVPVVMQPGRQAAANILPFRRDETASATDYHNPGTPATIRRVQAVAQMGAWTLWLRGMAGLAGRAFFRITGFHNRLLVLVP